MKNVFSSKNLFTVPNAITLFRLLLIPVFVWLYLGREAVVPAFLVYLAAGLLDVLDGRIARRFNMISEFGIMFDPIVDKLSQAVIFFCLLRRFPNMLLLLIVLIIKEGTLAIMSLRILRNAKAVEPAEWPGKLTSLFLNITAMIHILWSGLPAAVSNILIVFCSGMLLFSFVYYAVRNRKILCDRQDRQDGMTGDKQTGKKDTGTR